MHHVAGGQGLPRGYQQPAFQYWNAPVNGCLPLGGDWRWWVVVRQHSMANLRTGAKHFSLLVLEDGMGETPKEQPLDPYTPRCRAGGN